MDVQGHRLHGPPVDNEAPYGVYWPAANPKFAGYWILIAPNGTTGMLNPAVHSIVEHDDGTITVTPSIVFHDWHGHLTEGVWSEC